MPKFVVYFVEKGTDPETWAWCGYVQAENAAQARKFAEERPCSRTDVFAVHYPYPFSARHYDCSTPYYIDREAEILLEGERFKAARPVLAEIGIDEATARITDWRTEDENGTSVWTGVVHLAGDLDVISGEVRLEFADGDISPRSASARLPDGLVEWSRPAALVP